MARLGGDVRIPIDRGLLGYRIFLIDGLRQIVGNYVAAGMDDHVSKPIDVQPLSLAIARVLKPGTEDLVAAYSA